MQKLDLTQVRKSGIRGRAFLLLLALPIVLAIVAGQITRDTNPTSAHAAFWGFGQTSQLPTSDLPPPTSHPDSAKSLDLNSLYAGTPTFTNHGYPPFIPFIPYQVASLQAVDAPSLMLLGKPLPVPDPEPTPVTAASNLPAPAQSQVSSETGGPKPVPPPPPTDGVPWYVPSNWHEAYLVCIGRPDRHSFEDWVWRASIQGGDSDGWDYNEAMAVIAHEGGDDLCQFNTAGSGACGPFQLLTCPSDGLTPEGQIAGAVAKWKDGGKSFNRHWRAYW